MTLRRFCLLLAGLTFAAGARVASAQDLRLGFVNMRRAMEEAEEGKKAKTKLKQELETKQKELDEQQENIKKSMQDLEKKRTLLPQEKVAEKEAEIRGQLEKVQQAYLRHQQDLASKEQQALGPVLARMQRIIAKIASTENLTMVFDQEQAGLLFAKPHLDLTNELIRRFNAGEGVEAAGAAGAAKKPGAPGAKAPPVPAAPPKKK